MPVNDMFATSGVVREDGRMVHDMYLVQVKAPGDVKQPWDYYKVLRRSKARTPSDRWPRASARCSGNRSA